MQTHKRVFSSLLFHESNSFNPIETTHEDFLGFTGEGALGRMESTAALRSAGVEVVGGIWRMALSSGPVAVDSFEVLLAELKAELLLHQNLDGVLLHLHGSLQVADGVSGDFQIISLFRKILGPNIPIVLAMDPHANLSAELIEQVDGICAYNTIPHVDQGDTEVRAAQLLLHRIHSYGRTTPVALKLPLVIGGDSAIDTMTPVQEIYASVNKAITSQHAFDGNFFIGFSWSDSPNIGATVVLNPRSGKDRETCRAYAYDIAKVAWRNRANFIYSEQSFDIQRGVSWALAQTKPVALTDTGDNTTGGAPGWGTAVLQTLLQNQELIMSNKRICLGPIRDDTLVHNLAQVEIGSSVSFEIGDGSGEDRPIVSVVGKVTAIGALLGYLGSVTETVGKTVTVRVGQLDLVISDHPSSFVTTTHFSAAGLRADDYDVVIVKQGYVFPEIKQKWPISAFLLSPGATKQVFTQLPFQKRPNNIYPFETETDWT